MWQNILKKRGNNPVNFSLFKRLLLEKVDSLAHGESIGIQNKKGYNKHIEPDPKILEVIEKYVVEQTNIKMKEGLTKSQAISSARSIKTRDMSGTIRNIFIKHKDLHKRAMQKRVVFIVRRDPVLKIQYDWHELSETSRGKKTRRMIINFLEKLNIGDTFTSSDILEHFSLYYPQYTSTPNVNVLGRTLVAFIKVKQVNNNIPFRVTKDTKRKKGIRYLTYTLVSKYSDINKADTVDTVDREAWKNHIDRDSNILRQIRDAIFSYDFIMAPIIATEDPSNKIGVSINKSGTNEYTIRTSSTRARYEEKVFNIGDAVMGSLNYSIDEEIQEVVDWIIDYWEETKPERRAHGFMDGVIEGIPEATIENNAYGVSSVKVIGNISNRTYWVPLQWDDDDLAHCWVFSKLEIYKRSKSEMRDGKTFEDLNKDKVDIKMCFQIEGKVLPTGDRVANIVLSLRNEEVSRKNISTLDAFLSTDEVPDFDIFYEPELDFSPQYITHESAEKYLAGNAIHPFVPQYE